MLITDYFSLQCWWSATWWIYPTYYTTCYDNLALAMQYNLYGRNGKQAFVQCYFFDIFLQ